MNNKPLAIATLLSASLVLSACTTINPYSGEEQTSNVAKGAAIGAISGAVLGAAIKDKDRKKGALIGAAAGAAAAAASVRGVGAPRPAVSGLFQSAPSAAPAWSPSSRSWS